MIEFLNVRTWKQDCARFIHLERVGYERAQEWRPESLHIKYETSISMTIRDSRVNSKPKSYVIVAQKPIMTILNTKSAWERSTRACSPCIVIEGCKSNRLHENINRFASFSWRFGPRKHRNRTGRYEIHSYKQEDWIICLYINNCILDTEQVSVSLG